MGVAIPHPFLTKFSLITLILIQLLSFGNGYQVNNNPFTREEPLDDGKFLLRWHVDWDLKQITFNVTVETRGWIGLGFSNNGTMEAGADVVIGGVNRDSSPYLSDRHLSPGAGPFTDTSLPDESQDYRLLSSWESRTHTFLSFSRPLDTCDEEDYPLTLNKLTIVWKYGSADDEEGAPNTLQNRGLYHVHLLDPDYAPEIVRTGREGTPTLITRGRNENIPRDTRPWSVRRTWDLERNDTSYICSIHRAPKLRRKHHLIGVAVHFPDEVSKRHTHHLIFSRCRPPRGIPASQFFGSSVSNPGEPCYPYRSYTGAEHLRFPINFCVQLYHTWAIGGPPLFFPDHIGTPFGGGDDLDENEFYLVNMHYDNPQRLSGLRVEARLDFFYTSELRPIEGGTTQFQHDLPGLPETLLVPPNTADLRSFTHCAPECTRRMLPPQGFTISAVMLHSHNAGIGMRLRHFRGNRELPWIIYDDNYDNFVQPNRHLREERRVLPGDQVTIECHMRANQTVIGGFSTRTEMCTIVILYYNRDVIEDYGLCNSGINSPEGRRRFLGIDNVTWVQEDVLEWVVETPRRLQGLKVTEVSDRLIDWSPERRRRWHEWHETATQTGRCSKDISTLTLEEYLELPWRPPGVTDPGPVNTEDNWVGPVGYPFSATPYVPPPRSCPRRG